MMVIACFVGAAMIPILYLLFQAWTVSRETTDLSRRRHKEKAAELVERQKLVAARRARSGQVGLWARLTGSGKG